MIDAREHGIVGDGITDDAPALQALIDSAGSEPIYLPSGEYLLVGGDPRIPVLRVASGTTLIGDGRGTHLRCEGGPDQRGIGYLRTDPTGPRVEGVALRDLDISHLTPYRTKEQAHAVFFYGPGSGLDVSNVRIRECTGGDGFYTGNWFEDVTYTNCRTHNVARSGFVLGGYGERHGFRIYDCVATWDDVPYDPADPDPWQRTTGRCIDIEVPDGAKASGLHIRGMRSRGPIELGNVDGCLIESSVFGHLVSVHALDTTIRGCTITRYADPRDSETAPYLYTNAVKIKQDRQSMLIEGCRIRQLGPGAAVVTEAPMSYLDPPSMWVRDNWISRETPGPVVVRYDGAAPGVVFERNREDAP